MKDKIRSTSTKLAHFVASKRVISIVRLATIEYSNGTFKTFEIFKTPFKHCLKRSIKS